MEIKSKKDLVNVMITKELIDKYKKNNVEEIYKLLKTTNSSSEIKFVLKNLGKLPKNFEKEYLIYFVNNDDSDIRFWVIKNLGKLLDISLLNLFNDVAKNDPDSMVRREAVSSIGRMRSRKAKHILMFFIEDKDPKIVLQAIRGLLYLDYKNDKEILSSLMDLKTHPNEMIQAIIEKKFENNDENNGKQVSHTASPDYLKNTIVHGDVREILRSVPDESIHLTFTSPPYYNARDYSTYTSYSHYLDFLTEVFNIIHRITKEGRFLIINTSPIIIPRISREFSSKRYPIPFDLHNRIVENGWDFIDDIVWLKPESSAKNRNAGFLQHRKPLAYKPNAITEYLMVYRKHTMKLLDWNMRQYDYKIVKESLVINDYETSNVWQIDPTFDRIHSAVFPLELCNRVIKFYSYIGDLVFDPFGGSGTLGKSALNLKRYFFLTEIQKKYIDRMKRDLGNPNLFYKRQTKFFTLNQFIKTVKDSK